MFFYDLSFNNIGIDIPIPSPMEYVIVYLDKYEFNNAYEKMHSFQRVLKLI